MFNNAWFKLAAVSLAGIVISFVVLWGINEFSRNNAYGNMNMGYGYPMNGMQMGQQNGMNAQGGVNMQGNMNMNGMNMQGGMNAQGSMNAQQGGMGMGMMQNGMSMMNNMMQNDMMMGGMSGNMQGGMQMH